MPFLDMAPPNARTRNLLNIGRCEYDVPANIVLAVAEKEAGKPGQWVKNSNGTHDVGPMQLNTSYLEELARYWINTKDVAASGCYPFDLAAWLHIRKDNDDLWTRAANCHSRTPQYNVTYRADLMRKAIKWADWLNARFATDDIKKWNATTPAPANIQPTASIVEIPSLTTPAYVPRRLLVSPGAQ
jgi:hypothetical protein